MWLALLLLILNLNQPVVIDGPDPVYRSNDPRIIDDPDPVPQTVGSGLRVGIIVDDGTPF